MPKKLSDPLPPDDDPVRRFQRDWKEPDWKDQARVVTLRLANLAAVELGAAISDARRVARRATSAAVGTAVCGAGGALVGAYLGALGAFEVRKEHASHGEGRERLRKSLMQKVQMGGFLRQVTPMLGELGTKLEYDATKQLEDHGFFPCGECGVPHTKHERHIFPPGTYWDTDAQEYVQPDDERWTAQGYQRCTGERWDLPDESDEPEGGGRVH